MMTRTAWIGYAAAGACLAAMTAAGAEDAANRTVNNVRLVLTINGVGGDGCGIEIKPGHPGCDFPTVSGPLGQLGPLQHVAGGYVVTLPPIQATSTNPDRDCSFAITLTEPGRPPKTFHRGLRLAASAQGQPVPSQDMNCYLSTPSVVAEGERSARRK